MSTFKNINKSSTLIEKNVVSYKHTFTTASVGIQSIKIVSGSISQSYWDSLNVMFYTSGSPVYGSETKLELDNFSYKDRKQHLNKYHGLPSSSIITIGQRFYGERIKSGSFKYTDLNSSGTPIIKDDGFGNLFPVNNTVSHSTNSPSSSDNFVGNIFYEHGIAVITETSSYSHTPSTATITLVGMSTAAGINHFFLTGSNLSTSIKFVSTGSTETDTSSIKFFWSGSTTAATAILAANKVNSVFGGLHITASTSASVLKLSNDANSLTNRKPTTTLANLPPISGSGGFSTGSGFSGGAAAVNYSDFGTNFTLDFESQDTKYTQEYEVTLKPNEFNHTMNYSARMPIGTFETLNDLTASILNNEYLASEFTSSDWQPYITRIHLYQNGDYDTPVITANLVKPIRKSDKIPITFKIKLDM